MCWRSVRLEIRAMTAGDYTSVEEFCVAIVAGFWTEVIAKRRSREWVLAGLLALLLDWARTPPTILLDSLGEPR